MGRLLLHRRRYIRFIPIACTDGGDLRSVRQSMRMLLHEWLTENNGIAHASDISGAGFSREAVATALSQHLVTRVRRSWIALRECDPAVRDAVRAGGRLTCVSAARTLGLWTPKDQSLHVAAPPGAGKMRRPGLVIHWSTGPAPTRRRDPIEPLINVLHHVARCLKPPAALTVWESALNRRLIAPVVLERVAWTGFRERRLASVASQLSDSGLETQFLVLMRTIGVTVAQQVWIDGHRVDTLIGDSLIVQLDGFAHHSDPVARRRDIEADARLRLRGFTVLRFDHHQLFFEPEFVTNTIRAAIAQGLHRA